MPHPALDGLRRRNDAILAFARRPELAARLLEIEYRRIVRVRGLKHLSYRDEHAAADAEEAIKYGFYLALMARFSEERGITDDWWREQRRAVAAHAKDRSEDPAILYAHYPEFEDYYADLTDDEVLTGARAALQQMLAGRGSDYYHYENQQRHRRANRTFKDGVEREPVAREADYITPPTLDTESLDNLDALDPTAQDRVENFDYYRALEDDDDVLGPVLTLAAIESLKRYSENGLFWLLEFQFFPKRFTEMLRTMSGSEEELGAKEFEAIKKDLSRKCPQVREDMLAALRDDRKMLELEEMLRGEIHTTPAPLPPSAASVKAKQNVENERAGAVERRRVKLIRQLKADPEVAGLLFDVMPLIRGDAFTPTLTAYGLVRDDFGWMDFKRDLKKQIASAL